MSIEADDNPRILEIIKERMEIGLERYGHGLRAGDDTTQWGTKKDSWIEMGIEEVLDLTIYLAAALIRIEDERKLLAEERAVLEMEQVALAEERAIIKKQADVLTDLHF